MWNSLLSQYFRYSFFQFLRVLVQKSWLAFLAFAKRSFHPYFLPVHLIIPVPDEPKERGGQGNNILSKEKESQLICSVQPTLVESQT